jgi:hypothetical protein
MQAEDPREAAATGLPPDVTIIPMYPLYSPGQLSLAAFLGGPIGAAWLLAINYRRLGQRRHAVLAVVVAALAVIGLAAIGMMSTEVPRIGIGVLVATILICRALQGEAFRSHVARQGRVASTWRALGVGLAVLAVMAVPVVLIEEGIVPAEIQVHDCEAFYTDGATIDEARAACNELIALHYFDHGRASIKITHPHGRATVEFVVNEQVFGDAEITQELRNLAAPLAQKVFAGQPVDLVLDDSRLEPHATLSWEDRPDAAGH